MFSHCQLDFPGHLTSHVTYLALNKATRDYACTCGCRVPASCDVLAGGHILTFLIPYIRTWAKDIEVRTVPFSSFLNRDKRQLSRCLICPRAIISSPLFCFVFKLFPTGSMHFTGNTIFSRIGNLREVKIGS